MLITTLIEDHSDEKNNYESEHGLSLYIEDEGEHILFDTGQTGLFTTNAVRMGIDLTQVDKVVLSHGHYDHTGGMERFVEETKYSGPIYVGASFFDPKYSKKEEDYVFRGVTFDEEQGDFRYMDQAITKLSQNIDVITQFKRTNPYECRAGNFFIKEDNYYRPDNFTDEISLVLKTKQGIVLVVGCSHIGIMNIIHQVRTLYHEPLRGIIGGTHMIAAKPKRLLSTINYIEKLNLEFVALSHCTGDQNMKQLKDVFGEQFIFNCTGNSILL